MIWQHLGAEYTLAGVAVLLHRIGWSVQVPARRAAERDEADCRVAGGGLDGFLASTRLELTPFCNPRH